MAKEKPKENKENKGRQRGSEPDKDHPQHKEGKKDTMDQKDSQRRIMIVRVAGRDLDGAQPLSRAIRSVRGVSFSLGNAIADASGMADRKVGELSHEEIAKVEGMLKKPWEHGVPAWLLNRRGDPTTGEDRHIVSADLDLTQKMDINELKKKRCYKGVRHTAGLPVRGQRTRSSFRKSGKAVGVNRVKAKAAKSTAPSDKKK